MQACQRRMLLRPAAHACRQRTRGPHRRFTLGVDTSQNASQTKGKAMMLCASTYAAMSAKMTWCTIAVGSPSSRKWMSIEARSYTR